ncbi:MAG: hypothetical protein HUU29_13195 [Planctomycetaceae bacterium]|nr:hypothetical protein [Planctomycetaceae bacterium]
MCFRASSLERSLWPRKREAGTADIRYSPAINDAALARVISPGTSSLPMVTAHTAHGRGGTSSVKSILMFLLGALAGGGAVIGFQQIPKHVTTGNSGGESGNPQDADVVHGLHAQVASLAEEIRSVTTFDIDRCEELLAGIELASANLRRISSNGADAISKQAAQLLASVTHLQRMRDEARHHKNCLGRHEYMDKAEVFKFQVKPQAFDQDYRGWLCFEGTILGNFTKIVLLAPDSAIPTDTYAIALGFNLPAKSLGRQGYSMTDGRTQYYETYEYVKVLTKEERQAELDQHAVAFQEAVGDFRNALK